ncbi:MAG: hypothetical protein PHI28_17780 [Mangrovibacterium sp.]|nr:hypothetical protein [Mangrovibacterium sp.]
MNQIMFVKGVLATEEIDFVGTRNGETLYVQVSVELPGQETIEREFGNHIGSLEFCFGHLFHDTTGIFVNVRRYRIILISAYSRAKTPW